MRGVPLGKELNREQVRYLCQEAARIQAMPNGSHHGRPQDRVMVRIPEWQALSKKLGISSGQAQKIASGGVKGYRRWVVEWMQEQKPKAAQTNGLPPHVKGTRYAPEYFVEARKLREAGMDDETISKKLGVPAGSITYLANSVPPRGRIGKLNRAQPKAAARTSAKREEDWGQNFRAYVEAEEEKARVALQAKHEEEREALEEQLKKKRNEVIDKLLNMYTTPEQERMD